jgi:heme/copper-type cytochrome/quinol oxidase subunit 2
LLRARGRIDNPPIALLEPRVTLTRSTGCRILASTGVALVFFAGCAADLPVPVDAVSIELTSHRADWNAAYLLPGREGSENRIATGREVHVPRGADVTLVFSSREYISNFFAPDLGLREFAAPGLPGYFRFRAQEMRRYELRADELCGLPHPERLVGVIVVESPKEFEAWVRGRRR